MNRTRLLLCGLLLFLTACDNSTPQKAEATSSICTDELGVELPDCNQTAVETLLEGAPNFRAISLSVEGGIKLKEGVLYRSEALHNLTDSEI